MPLHNTSENVIHHSRVSFELNRALPLSEQFPLYEPSTPKPYFGDGSITGLIDIKGILLTDAIVELFEETTKDHVFSTITDGLGRYTFTGLSISHQFFIVVKEPSGEWEYRISSRRTPVII